MRYPTRRACPRRGRLSFAALLAVSAAAPGGEAQEPGSQAARTAVATPPFSDVEYLLDASGSMRARFGERTKLDAARAMLAALDRELERGGSAPRPSLWAYGAAAPRERRDCSDARVLGRGRGPTLERTLQRLEPTGVSPLVHALDRVLAADSTATSEAWVLFTDGGDNCGRDPCEWAPRGAAGGNPRIYVVGLALDPQDAAALRCLTQGTSGYLLDLQPGDGWESEMSRLAAVLQNRGAVRIEVEAPGGGDSGLQGRIFRAGSPEPLRVFRTGAATDLPGGVYRIVVETLPPTAFERVLVVPGAERSLAIADVARLTVQAYGADNRPQPAYAALSAVEGSGDEQYFPAGQPAFVRAGTYRLRVELGDSVALRETLDLGAGETRRVTVGGTGWVRARAPGLPQLAGVEVELHDYSTGRASAVRPWSASAAVPAGEYRAVVRSLPVYVQERFTVAPAETSALLVPGLGTLQVDLTDSAGRALSAPVTLLRSSDSAEDGDSVEGTGPIVIGTFTTGVRQAVLAGTYDLLLETTPSRVARDVRVLPGSGRVVSLAAGSR